MLQRRAKPSEAEAEYRKALAILQKLADDNPAVTDSASASRAATMTSAVLLSDRASHRKRRPSSARRWRSDQKLADDNPAVTEFRSSLCEQS